MSKIAFLVATDECPQDPGIPRLLFPKSDAETLAEILADKETCGFEPHVHVNEPSYVVLEDLYSICGQLKADDTLLFYYSGHGVRHRNELCLVSSNTKLAALIPTSIKAADVLGCLRDSSAKRRIYSGTIGLVYKAADADSSLDALGNDFGTCILTASTSIQQSEEREKDGHGLFTKALIDCLREPQKESINVDDWYLYAVNRFRVSESQKPTKCGYVEGGPIEIGNFRQRFARLKQQELEQLISAAHDKFAPYVRLGDFSEADVEEVVALLKREEAKLTPRNRKYRGDIIRFLRGDAGFLEVFGAGALWGESNIEVLQAYSRVPRGRGRARARRMG